ncbi:22464_t:CDS:2, partial [Entrophospora sp. SA101]
SRSAEVAIECCVDICKASTYVSRKDSLALRLIVPEIENDLRERLFDPVRSLTYDNQFNQSLMTDCLTALFKLNNTTLRSFIPVCLNENAPSVFKLVLVKSCYVIASDENKFPWNPQLSTMYPVLATPLRSLFHQYITSRDKLDVKKKKQTKERPDETNERMEIILTILKLYKSDPLLVLIHSDANENPEEIQMVIYGMTLCVNDYNPVIRTTAAETLLKLHDLKYIEQWSPNGKKMRNFWAISSQVMLAIARQILEYKEPEESTKYLLDLLLQLFKRRNEFLKAHKDESHIGINIPERLGCNIVLEVALLVLLCSSDTEICSMSMSCFGHLCQEAQLLTTELIGDEVDVQAVPHSELPI